MLMFFNKMRKSKFGYTLTELIVVVAILGILAAVATPAVMKYTSSAKTNTDNANAKTLENAIKRALSSDEFTLAQIVTSGGAISAVFKDEISPMPTPKQGSGYAFYVNTSTAAVECVASTPTPSAPWVPLS